MSSNGNDDIPGAPWWLRHLLGRIDDRFDVFAADLAMAVSEFRGVRGKVADHDERLEKAEAKIIQLEGMIRRSLTPPSGIPAVGNGDIPDDAA
jgi:hypothetical protein